MTIWWSRREDQHLFDSIPQTALPVTKYSTLKGIINPYSWGAFVTNDLTQINVGITSRNILSTTCHNCRIPVRH